MRQFIEVTVADDDGDRRSMISMLHIKRIAPAKDGCAFMMEDGEVLAIRENYQRICAVLSGLPIELVDMMEKDMRQ